MNLSQLEVIWLLGLIFELFAVGLWAFISRRNLTWFTPPIFYGIVIGYYIIGGTLFFSIQDNFFDRGIDLRDTIVFAIKGGFVSYGSFLIAFFTTFKKIKKKRYTTLNPFLALKLGRFMNKLGIFIFFLVAGPSIIYMLNPINVEISNVSGAIESILGGYGGILGPFANYGGLAINLLIPGTLLIAAFYFKTKKGLIELLIWFFVSFSIYTTLGFRYRLLILFLGLINIRALTKISKVNFLKYTLFFIFLIFFLGVFGQIRSYGVGLNIGNFSGGFLSTFGGIFSEAKIFFTTGRLMSIVPEQLPYIGLKPLINTIISPLPSYFIENKNTADYVFQAITTIYGTQERSRGASFMNFGEYYYMGGWASVIFCSAVFGALYKFSWKWFYSR